MANWRGLICKCTVRKSRLRNYCLLQNFLWNIFWNLKSRNLLPRRKMFHRKFLAWNRQIVVNSHQNGFLLQFGQNCKQVHRNFQLPYFRPHFISLWTTLHKIKSSLRLIMLSTTKMCMFVSLINGRTVYLVMYLLTVLVLIFYDIYVMIKQNQIVNVVCLHFLCLLVDTPS